MADKEHGLWQQKKTLEFPSYNYPSSTNPSQSFLEYGNASLVNLDVGEQDGVIRMHSARGHRRSKFHLVATQPSIPFLSPNNCSSVADVDQIKYEMEGTCVQWKPSLNERNTFRKINAFNNAGKHFRNLFCDHPEIMFGCTAELVQAELFDSNFQLCNTHAGSNVKKIIKSGRHYKECRLCRVLCKPPERLTRLSWNLHEGLSDIPSGLLYDLLNESYEKKIAEWHYNSLQGNGLACSSFERPGNEPSACCIVCYPSGCNLDELNTGYFTESGSSDETHETTDTVISPHLSCVSSQKFKLQGRLNQLDSSVYPSSQVFVGARTQYQCSFLTGFYNTDKNVVSVKPAGTLATSKQVMSLSLNPYICGEAVVAMETGTVYLWSVEKDLQKIWQPSAMYERSDSWQQVVFGAHPRQIVLATTSGVDLLDFRAGLGLETSLLSLPSSQFSSYERFSAIQRNPQNTHHYLAATDQSLVILDDRFFQSPVLKWHHHLRTPGQFLQVINNLFPDCDDGVIVISGSLHYESHCYQYCPGYEDTQSSMMLTGGKNILPPSSTSLQWKVSSYDEWPMLSHGDTSIPPKLSRELSRPLIGLGIMPHSKTFGGGFTVLQMSAAGNLFQQHFMIVPVQDENSDYDGQRVNKTASVRFDMHQTKMTCDNIAKCRDWVQMFMEQDRKLRPNNCDYNSNCSSLLTAVNKTRILLKMTNLREAHPSCSVCYQTSQTVESRSAEHDIDTTCERCGLDLLVSAKLKELQQGNKVVTNGNLKIDSQVQELSLVTELDNSKDPLSSCLLWNWSHDIVKPLDIGVHGDDASVDDKNMIESIMPLKQTDSSGVIHDKSERPKESHQLSQLSCASPDITHTEVPTDSPTDQVLASDHTAANSQRSKDNAQLSKGILKRSFCGTSSPSLSHQQVEIVSARNSKKPRKKIAYSMGF